MEKKGQGLNITAIILIILGIVVMAFLLYYFVLGGNKLTPFVNTGSNVDTIATQCQTACSLNQKYDFCTRAFNLTINGKIVEANEPCSALATNSQYGIAACPAISCS